MLCFKRHTLTDSNLVLTCVQPYHSEGLGESFPLMWLNIGVSSKESRYVFFSQPNQVQDVRTLSNRCFALSRLAPFIYLLKNTIFVLCG